MFVEYKCLSYMEPEVSRKVPEEASPNQVNGSGPQAITITLRCPVELKCPYVTITCPWARWIMELAGARSSTYGVVRRCASNKLTTYVFMGLKCIQSTSSLPIPLGGRAQAMGSGRLWPAGGKLKIDSENHSG